MFLNTSTAHVKFTKNNPVKWEPSKSNGTDSRSPTISLLRKLFAFPSALLERVHSRHQEIDNMCAQPSRAPEDSVNTFLA